MRIRKPKIIKWLLWMGAAFLVLNLIYPLPREKIEEGFSRTIRFADGRINFVSLTQANTLRIYTPPEQIPEKIKECFIGYEDRWFYYHPGINPLALGRAFWQNLRYGRIISGGSTITMQIARMMEPKERTIGSKIKEIFRSFQLELAYSKEEILGIYLNMIPMGGNLEGIGSGAYYYFEKNPHTLSIGEIALLIGIPQSPNKSRPDINRQGAIKTRDKILERLMSKNMINAKEYESAIKTKPRKERSIPPFIAPHLTMKLLKSQGKEHNITMTLDPRTQTMSEELLKGFREELDRGGVKNAALLVVNNRTCKVEAWVGNFAYENRNEYMIDGVTIKRSPGSTLKPFIYGMAIDSGLITPRYILYDVKRYYAGYKVENYDKKYHGPLTATEALTRSLNSPAVYLLQQLQKGSLFPLLDSLGYEVAEGDDLGLSVALGAKEITLFNLVKNYTAFSNDGVVKELAFTQKETSSRGKPLLSKESAWMVSDMLSRGTRLDLPRSWEFATGKGRIAWKTGTSYGNFDALCVGYNRDYTVGVWVGNADRTPSKALVGSRTAAPILFKLFNALTMDRGNWFIRPENVKQRQVSAESGKLPRLWSPHIITDEYIPGVSTMNQCDRFIKVLVDQDTGYSVIKDEGKNVKEFIWEVYPSEALPWVQKNLFSYSPPPPYDPRQLQYLEEPENLTILSPLPKKTYYLNPYRSMESQKIPLIAEPFPGSTKFYWFLDGVLFKEGPVGQDVFLTPRVGSFNLLCLDNRGRSSSRLLRVEAVR